MAFKYRKRSFILLFAAILLAFSFLFSGCSGWQGNTIRIGYVNPVTGALAGNAEGCDWSIEKIYDYVRENPILINGREAKLEIILYDSESDTEKCRAMAERLAVDDKVDLLIAAQTPETVIPVTSVAEEYGIPCISIQAPVDPIANARERYDWTYHSFWTIDSVYQCYRDLWTTAGFPAGCGARIGMLFANDADGTAWHDIFLKKMAEDGYVPVDPGQYPPSNEDFSGIAEIFAQSDIDIITGTNLPPDFMNAMIAMQNRGVSVSCITMGKCCILETDAAAMGDLADGLLCEVMWTASKETVSDLTGISAEELNRQYFEENFGRDMSPPAAYGYASLELAVHAFNNAGSRNKEALLKAISELDVNTVVGPIKYDKQMNGLHYGETLIGGGQWQVENGLYKLKVIDNTLYPQIPLDGTYIPKNALNR